MRLDGWESRLALVVDQYRAKPFAWGEADCLLWPAAVVEALTGSDPAAAYRGSYHDAQGARRVLRKIGFKSGPALIAAWFKPVPAAHAWRGDIAVITEPNVDDPLGAAGVVLGSHLAGYGSTGLVFVPRSAATRTYRVE